LIQLHNFYAGNLKTVLYLFELVLYQFELVLYWFELALYQFELALYLFELALKLITGEVNCRQVKQLYFFLWKDLTNFVLIFITINWLSSLNPSNRVKWNIIVYCILSNRLNYVFLSLVLPFESLCIFDNYLCSLIDCYLISWQLCYLISCQLCYLIQQIFHFIRFFLFLKNIVTKYSGSQI